MLYNFTHTHIGDLWLRLRTEEKLANLSKLIGRLLKMIKLEGAVTEKKRSPETTKGKKKTIKKWLLCQRHPLFVYFNKLRFALIIHDNACPGRSVPPVSPQQRLLLLQQPARFFLRLWCFSRREVRQLEGGRFMHTCCPFLEQRREAGKGRAVPVQVWGRLVLCLCQCPELSRGGVGGGGGGRGGLIFPSWRAENGNLEEPEGRQLSVRA